MTFYDYKTNNPCGEIPLHWTLVTYTNDQVKFTTCTWREHDWIVANYDISEYAEISDYYTHVSDRILATILLMR